jgi:uncharacterized membrane protein
MVLELKVPHVDELSAVSAEALVLLAYVLGFINVGL